MLLLNASLERSEQPPLEQRGDVMNARHDFVSLFTPAADDRNAMLVTRGREAGIAFPSVRVDCCARLYGLSNEVQQAFGGDTVDAPQADAPDSTAVFLCRDHNDGLFLDLATPLALFRASNVGFVDLDLAGKAITARPDHRSAQFVHPRPSRFVAAQAQHPLQAQGADAILLTGGEPHRKEPCPQWLAGVLEHRAGRQRRVAMASLASKYPARHYPRLPDNPATPANESVGPPQAADVVATTHLSAEPFVHFFECARVISARGRVYIFHGATVSAFAGGVKGIPISAKCSTSSRHGPPPIRPVGLIGCSGSSPTGTGLLRRLGSCWHREVQARRALTEWTSDALEPIWIKRLRLTLLDGTYRPTPVKRIYIPKANGKLRPLGIPILLDRIVQRAMLMAMEPIWESDFHAGSYGFRP